jgi:hypothetical protein
MRNVSDKRCKENQNTHFTSNNFSLSLLSPPPPLSLSLSHEIRAVYEMMVDPDKPQTTVNKAHALCTLDN